MDYYLKRTSLEGYHVIFLLHFDQAVVHDVEGLGQRLTAAYVHETILFFDLRFVHILHC